MRFLSVSGSALSPFWRIPNLFGNKSTNSALPFTLDTYYKILDTNCVKRIYFIFTICYLIFTIGGASAAAPTPKTGEVGVKVEVKGFVINISGFTSPYASIVLTIEGQFMSSTTTDSQGNFSFINIGANPGLSEACFDTIDFKRLGESQSCLTFAPLSQNQSFTNVFLPPTIGLYKKQINAGEEALIYGYSMPGAQVEVKLDTGKIFSVAADSGGYYEYRYKNVPAGKYLVSSSARRDKQISLLPKKKAELASLTLASQVEEKIKEGLKVGLAEDLKRKDQAVTQTNYGILLLIALWVLFPVIILILVVKKKWPRKTIKILKL